MNLFLFQVLWNAVKNKKKEACSPGKVVQGIAQIFFVVVG